MSDDELEAWVGELDEGWVRGGWDRRGASWRPRASKTTLDRPSLIEDAVTAKVNGTYTARLYDDGRPVDVTVTPDMVLWPDGRPAFVNNQVRGDEYELWPLVLEKELALRAGDYSQIEGGHASEGMEMLTGRESDSHDPGDMSASGIRSVLDAGGCGGPVGVRLLPADYPDRRGVRGERPRGPDQRGEQVMGCAATRSAAGVVLVGVVVLLAGCSPEAQVQHPEGAVRLVETQPRTIGDVSAVVGNLTATSAVLSVAGGDGPAEAVDVEVGDVVELEGHSFEVVDIVDDSEVPEDAGDGASTAAVWVVVD